MSCDSHHLVLMLCKICMTIFRVLAFDYIYIYIHTIPNTLVLRSNCEKMMTVFLAANANVAHSMSGIHWAIGPSRMPQCLL